MSEFKLNFELVPDACWGYNLRSILSKKDWDTVRTDAYRRAEGKCMICSRAVKRLEAHERWEYDEERGIQRLADVIAICHMCHSVIHINRSILVGEEAQASRWFMRVNGCSRAEYLRAQSEANAVHIRRNRIAEWQLDVSWLSRFD